MPLTLDEITAQKERLRSEIMERECILAALDVLHGYAAKGHHPQSLVPGLLTSILSPLADATPPRDASSKEAPAPALPAPPPPQHYVHPELAAIDRGFGENGRIVKWAIQRMADDYTVRDLAALLEREGYALKSAEISVVLTRMKNRGEIEEIKRGLGRRAAVFRRPIDPANPEAGTVDSIAGAEESSVPAATIE